jgi:hypothetical protein
MTSIGPPWDVRDTDTREGLLLCRLSMMRALIPARTCGRGERMGVASGCGAAMELGALLFLMGLAQLSKRGYSNISKNYKYISAPCNDLYMYPRIPSKLNEC